MYAPNMYAPREWIRCFVWLYQNSVDFQLYVDTEIEEYLYDHYRGVDCYLANYDVGNVNDDDKGTMFSFDVEYQVGEDDWESRTEQIFIEYTNTMEEWVSAVGADEETFMAINDYVAVGALDLEND